MPEIPDIIPGEETESDWANTVRDRTVMRYPSAAARDASVPSPAIGDMAVLLDTGELTMWDGSSWGWLVPDNKAGPFTSFLKTLRASSGFLQAIRIGSNQITFQILGGGAGLQVDIADEDGSNSAAAATISKTRATFPEVVAAKHITTGPLSFSDRVVRSIWIGAAEPSTAVTGDIWLDNNLKALKIYNGTVWTVALQGT